MQYASAIILALATNNVSFIGTVGQIVSPAISICLQSNSPVVAAAHLVEADILGLLTEALTAQVEVVLADKTSSVLADTAT